MEHNWLWIPTAVLCGVAIHIISTKISEYGLNTARNRSPNVVMPEATEDEEELKFSSEVAQLANAYQIINKDINYAASIKDSQGATVIMNQILLQKAEENMKYIDDGDVEHITAQLKTFWSSEGSWLNPLPWREENILPIEDYFVDLQLEELSRDGKTVKAIIKLEDILEPSAGNSLPPTRILASGHVGFGKSTILTKLAHLWATRDETFLARFRFLLMFRLRDLTPEDTLEGALMNIFEQQLIGSKKDAKGKLFSFLEKNNKDILLLIDGYDECGPEHLESVHKVLSTSSATIFGLSTILVTSRPLMLTIVNKYFHKQVRISGLTEPNRLVFIEKFFGSSPMLMSNIAKTLSIINPTFLSHISPIMLYLVCFAHEERQEAVYESHVELLDNVLILLGKRCCEKEPAIKNMTEDDIWVQLLFLGKFFYSGLRDNKVIIEQNELDKVFEGDQTFVKKCGLLRQPMTMFRRKTDVFEPVHKSFMEHLASKWLLFCLRQTTTPEQTEEFIARLKLPIFELSFVFKPIGTDIMLPVVSGVRFVHFLPTHNIVPEYQLSMGDSMFVTINDEKMTEYFHNYYGKGDTLKIRYEIGSINTGNTDSLCPISIPLANGYRALEKLAVSAQIFGRLKIVRLPQHVWIEVKKEDGEFGLAKYAELKSPNESVLRLIELDFAYNNICWKDFYQRLTTICNELLNTSITFRPEYAKLTAPEFLTNLVRSLSHNGLNRSVIFEIHRRPDMFRYLVVYHANQEIIWYNYLDKDGRHWQGELTEAEMYDRNVQILENVSFMENVGQAIDSLDSDKYNLVDRMETNVMLIQSSLKLWDDPERCQTLLKNRWRSDFVLKHDLNNLNLPNDRSISLLIDIHNEIIQGG